MIYRRLELRGEIRGGHFVSGMTGEQFGLPEAVEALRAVRKDPQAGAQEIRLSGSDPLNLVGIILPGRPDSIPPLTTRDLPQWDTCRFGAPFQRLRVSPSRL